MNMKTNKLRQDLQNKAVLHGIWRALPGDELTEIVAQAGFDFQIFDMEHSALDWTVVQSCVRINNLHGKQSWVRMGTRHPVESQRALDCGASGLVFPQLSHKSEFEEVASNTLFTPKGRRGYNPFVTGFDYGYNTASSIEAMNEEPPLVIAILETSEAMRQLDTLVQVPGIDIFYLGAYDLSVHLGVPGQVQHPTVVSAMEKALDTCKKAKRPVGLMIKDRKDFESWREKGVQIFLHGVDAGMIAKGFRASFS